MKYAGDTNRCVDLLILIVLLSFLERSPLRERHPLQSLPLLLRHLFYSEGIGYVEHKGRKSKIYFGHLVTVKRHTSNGAPTC